MCAALIQTKFSIPRVHTPLVARPRLLARLGECLSCRLVLLSAPPGFGKTTLAAECLRSSQHPAGWLSLDEDDNESGRFFTYLAAALQSIKPDLGRDALALLETGQLASYKPVMTSLVNDLSSLKNDVVLALDDYHLIRSPEVHEALQFLIERQPDTFHLVLITREDPPLPLPRLRVRGQMVEIREADLRFTPQEAADFLFQSMGLNLPSQAVAGLMARTEGWIAGLQMAALALQSQLSSGSNDRTIDILAAFQGDDRYVMDYLMDEVFRLQPRQVQDFLVQTAVLERLCASLCQAVTGTEAAQEMLAQLERANLFLTSLDHRREWYRYHPLFADLLRFRLQREYPEQIAELHRRASLWFKQNGDDGQAIKHALTIPDYELAADLAEEYMLVLIGGSRLGTYQQWVQRIPADVVAKRAFLCAGCGWVSLLAAWQPQEAERYAAAGEAALAQYQPVYSLALGRWITAVEVRDHLTAIRAHSARLRGDLPAAITLSVQALAELPDDIYTARGTVHLNLGLLYMMVGDLPQANGECLLAVEAALKPSENLNIALNALSVLAGMEVWQGRLSQAEAFSRRAIQLGSTGAGGERPDLAVGYAHGWQAAVHILRHELPAAERHLQQALELVTLIGARETILFAHLYQARLALEWGDVNRAQAGLQQAEEMIAAQPTIDTNRVEWAANRARLYLLQGQHEAAYQWLKSQGVDERDLEGEAALSLPRAAALRYQLPLYLLLAQALLAQNEPERAERLLGRVSNLAAAVQSFEAGLQAEVLLAAAASARRGGMPGAMQHLERALRQASPEGYVQPFLSAGQELEKLLLQAVAQGVQAAYAQRVLQEFAQRPPPAGVSGLAEPLTARESQLLRLLAAGLNSTQAAEQLVISVSTVRSYIKSLYSKLDAHNREEAIEKGRLHGLC